MTRSAAKMVPTLFVSNLPFDKRRNIIYAFSLRYKSTEKLFRILKHPAKVFIGDTLWKRSHRLQDAICSAIFAHVRAFKRRCAVR